MPLLTKIYETELLTDIKDGVKSGINDKLATALQDVIESEKFLKELRVGLDGSDEWAGEETNAQDINQAIKNIKERSKKLFADQAAALAKGDTPDEEEINTKIREITANEWANAISYNVVTWLNDLVVPEFSKVAADVYSDVFSDTISKVISERTEEYLKTASLVVIIPAGAVTVGAGPAAMPNPLPIELTLDPLLMKTLQPIAIPFPSAGGLN